MGFDYSAFRMNEDKYKLRLGKRKQLKNNAHGKYWFSYTIKPCGKFWKRYFNKKVRQGAEHKRGNWHEWC